MIKHHKLKEDVVCCSTVTILCALMSSGASMIINGLALMPHWKSLSNTSEGGSSFVITIYNSLDLNAQLVGRGEKERMWFFLVFKTVFKNQKVNLPRGPNQDQVSMKKASQYVSSSPTHETYEKRKVNSKSIITHFKFTNKYISALYERNGCQRY